MAVVAGLIMVGELFLFLKLPTMGLLCFPLACFLAASIALIPFREYRRVEGVRFSHSPHPSPEMVASALLRLQPQVRVLALIPLGLAAATSIFLWCLPGSSWGDRIPALGMMFLTAMFFVQFLRERRVLSSYEPTLGRIVGFQPTGRSRTVIYEYESPGGVVRGKGGSLRGFHVGMTVPVLYNVFKPDESVAVPDFLFYRIHNQPL